MKTRSPSEPEAVLQQHPHQLRSTVKSKALSKALRLGVRPFVHRLPGHPVGIRTARTATDAAARLLRPHPAVRIDPLIDPRVESGRSGRPVIGEWVRRIRRPRTDGAILYLHGGGYVVCSPRTHRPLTTRLAIDTRLPVFVPHYRLAPEHPFPAPLEDAMDAYRWLLDRGVPADRIVVAGDSAGGHLAASLAGEICRTELPSPAGVVLFSPWVDLTCELSTSWDGNCRDPYISPYAAQRISRLVVGATALDDPRLALLTSPWVETPPFFIQVGGAEVLRPEAERLAEVLTGSGTDCELQVWADQMHVFQMLSRVLPEARAAMQETARFIRTVVGDPVAVGETARLSALDDRPGTANDASLSDAPAFDALAPLAPLETGEAVA